MWVEKTSNGGLRLVDRIKINGKTKRVSVPLEKRTPQAIRKATEALLDKIQQIGHVEEKGPEMSLSEAIEDYLELKDCRKSTRKVVKSDLKNATTILGDGPLTALTPAETRRRFYKAQLPTTVTNRAIKAFRVFCKWCVDMEYLPDDPAKNLRLLKVEKEAPDPSTLYLEPDQLKDLLSKLHGMTYYLTRFLALTGCRIGEAAALLPEDIGDKYISITKAYSSNSGETTKPKNASSIRKVFIQPELRELLDEYLKWRNIDIMAYGIRPKTLFYSRTGTVMSEGLYGKRIAPYGIHPHLLRHTHVALLAEQGISLEAIARRIGHKGTGTTRDVYYHVTKKQREKDEMALAEVRIL